MTRYLVVANETLGGPALNDVIQERLAHGPASFHVVVPANHRAGLCEEVVAALEGAVPDRGQVAAEAQARLDRLLTSLRAAGAEAMGAIGDPDPMVAVEAALREQPFDEVIVSTLPPGASRWLAMDLVHRVQRAVDLPVTHVYGQPAPTR
jgi:hypothetical protein